MEIKENKKKSSWTEEERENRTDGVEQRVELDPTQFDTSRQTRDDLYKNISNVIGKIQQEGGNVSKKELLSILKLTEEALRTLDDLCRKTLEVVFMLAVQGQELTRSIGQSGLVFQATLSALMEKNIVLGADIDKHYKEILQRVTQRAKEEREKNVG